MWLSNSLINAPQERDQLQFIIIKHANIEIQVIFSYISLFTIAISNPTVQLCIQSTCICVKLYSSTTPAKEQEHIHKYMNKSPNYVCTMCHPLTMSAWAQHRRIMLEIWRLFSARNLFLPGLAAALISGIYKLSKRWNMSPQQFRR